ncbi:MAG: DUF1573 domain-containing protein [Desulfobacterales bacterium]|nr:DUF1573 domain-containing protein [Desulfobacterales bacterium]MCP4162623.1 DUF1573 domain-containing protein [Deltaproteobacteria bacterium]
MKTYKINVLLFIFLSIFILLNANVYASTKAPVVELESNVYEFKPVMEDTEVVHDYIIKNRGNVVLEITKVEPGCGCTAVSYTKFIPPGSVGKITIKFDTNGYGGKPVSKSILVESTDPKKGKFYLKLKGSVESFADINPRRVRLIGNFKDKIKSEIRIISKEKYPFKILEVSINDKTKVKFTLNKVKEDKISEYLLVVENLSMKKDRYFDTVTIKTDSKLKPEILLPLNAIIFDN